MRILVCGGRDFSQRQWVYDHLDLIHLKTPIKVLIVGGARGADQLAHDWACMRRVNAETFNADWERLGKAAGPLRNQQMIDEGKPDLVVAFPGGRGTADMVARARKARVEVKEIAFLS